jgi:hypothetical protein
VRELATAQPADDGRRLTQRNNGRPTSFTYKSNANVIVRLRTQLKDLHVLRHEIGAVRHGLQVARHADGAGATPRRTGEDLGLADLGGGSDANVAPHPDDVRVAARRADLAHELLAPDVTAATERRRGEAGVVGRGGWAREGIPPGDLHTGRRVRDGAARFIGLANCLQANVVGASRHPRRLEAPVFRNREVAFPQGDVHAGGVVGDAAALGTVRADGPFAEDPLAARPAEGVHLEARVGLPGPPVGTPVEVLHREGHAGGVPLRAAAEFVDVADVGGAVGVGAARRFDILKTRV